MRLAIAQQQPGFIDGGDPGGIRAPVHQLRRKAGLELLDRRAVEQALC
jgi:hypothetical protein